MGFYDLPAQPPFLHPDAIDFARKCYDWSLAASRRDDLRLLGDIAYGADYYQRVDVYSPCERLDGLPVIVFVHGGAFRAGYKEWQGFMAPPFVSLPAVFVSPSYRLAPEHRFPTPIEDVAASVAWVHKNIEHFGGDPQKIFIGGHSAGGQLATIVALDPRWLAPHGLSPSIFKGVLPISAPLNLSYDPTDPINDFPLNVRAGWLSSDDEYALADPSRLVRSDAPPFYITAGEKDLGRFAREAVEFHRMLVDRAVPAAIEIFPDLGHFDTNLECINETHPWVIRAKQFMLTARPPGSARRR